MVVIMVSTTKMVATLPLTRRADLSLNPSPLHLRRHRCRYRAAIAEDVVINLLYLHQSNSLIVHAILKPSNVLLGLDFESYLIGYALILSLLLPSASPPPPPSSIVHPSPTFPSPPSPPLRCLWLRHPPPRAPHQEDSLLGSSGGAWCQHPSIGPLHAGGEVEQLQRGPRVIRE